MQQPGEDDVTQEIGPWESGEPQDDDAASTGINSATVLVAVGVSAIIAALIVTIGLVGILLLHSN
ncbi:hypothetical protein DFR67_10738 [Williamsia limnetica]|jgi:hypothetical protein|uniref:Uncharacterized protein n=1 Tax=Williamsia limnetica TaxID=882452 RepID=A0A318RHN3_WILLI|nr:hypothetical protein [Williamsia limnetica]PYE16798.1 hypothetical protein DFR67_10738 [Williamsia limnetica]